MTLCSSKIIQRNLWGSYIDQAAKARGFWTKDLSQWAFANKAFGAKGYTIWHTTAFIVNMTDLYVLKKWERWEAEGYTGGRIGEVIAGTDSRSLSKIFLVIFKFYFLLGGNYKGMECTWKEWEISGTEWCEIPKELIKHCAEKNNIRKSMTLFTFFSKTSCPLYCTKQISH